MSYTLSAADDAKPRRKLAIILKSEWASRATRGIQKPNGKLYNLT